MYAVIATGGKQRRVQLGGRYQIERISTDLNETVTFDNVLLVRDEAALHIGQPILGHATVQAVVIDHAKGPKIRIVKMRRRKHSMTRTGHRQNYTWVRVTDIQVDGKGLKSELVSKETVESKPKRAPRKSTQAKKTQSSDQSTASSDAK